MPRTRTCDYCGGDIEPGTGTMFVRTNGTTIHYCSSKCENNHDLGREARNLEWTETGQPEESEADEEPDLEPEIEEAEADEQEEFEEETAETDEEDEPEEATDEVGDEQAETEETDEQADEEEETEAQA